MGPAGKSVIVTGGAHGIGCAYCERLARDGALVSCLDIDGDAADRVVAAIREAGGTAMALHADVRDLEQCRNAADRAARTFGRIDGLVNNAGMVSHPPLSRTLLEEIPDEEWDEAFRLMAKGTWYMTRAVLPHLRASGGGSIVNIGSSTIFKGSPTRAHYVAAKSALVGLTRVMSRELGGDWIRVNIVCPGSTLSEEDPTPAVVQLRERQVATRSLKRVERPEDLVGTVSFLLSDDSAFITGQTIVVEGGSVFS